MASDYGRCGVAVVWNGAEVALLLLAVPIAVVAVAGINVPGVILWRRFVEARVKYYMQNVGLMIIFWRSKENSRL